LWAGGDQALQVTARDAGFGVFTAREIDEACEFVLHRVAGAAPTRDDAAHALVAHLARHHPDAPALSPVLPLAMAAAALEGMLDGEAARRAAAAIWRDCALIATEVLALQAESPQVPPRLAALAARLGDGTPD
jgi:hypothetical protein